MAEQMTRRRMRELTVSDGAPIVDPSPGGDRARRTIRRVLGDVLLWIAAVGGVICITLVILAFTANITLIMFRTGSMSPTIPAGSVAVVQRVPASDIAVDDVVTVDREGELPVTHRVTTVKPAGSDTARVITMRGDANAQDDPFPYTVESVRIVRFSVPGIATVIVGMGNPYVLGSLTIGATLLVVWAFWPREARETNRREVAS